MADQKPEIKIEDEAAFTDNVEPEYRNYSSVARKPFEAEGEEKDTSDEAPETKSEAPKTPATRGAAKASGSDNK